MKERLLGLTSLNTTNYFKLMSALANARIHIKGAGFLRSINWALVGLSVNYGEPSPFLFLFG